MRDATAGDSSKQGWFGERTNDGARLQESDSVIALTEHALARVHDMFGDVGPLDHEKVVAGFMIAESNILVDVTAIPTTDRAMFSVVAQGKATQETLLAALTKHAGKVRLNLIHCHQFGMPHLSSTDVASYRSFLSDPELSQPYSDCRYMPVLLVSGSGRERELVGFIVTATSVESARVQVVRDDDPIVIAAFKVAPVAMPDLPRAEIIERIQERLPGARKVRLLKSRTTKDMAIRLESPNGLTITLDVGSRWPPQGLPRVIIDGEDLTNSMPLVELLDWPRLATHLIAHREDSKRQGKVKR